MKLQFIKDWFIEEMCIRDRSKYRGLIFFDKALIKIKNSARKSKEKDEFIKTGKMKILNG